LALTLRGIPPAAFDYRLGNRSAFDRSQTNSRTSTASPPTAAPASPTTQSRRRRTLHPPPHRPGHHRLPRNPEDHRHTPLPQLPRLNNGFAECQRTPALLRPLRFLCALRVPSFQSLTNLFLKNLSKIACQAPNPSKPHKPKEIDFEI